MMRMTSEEEGKHQQSTATYPTSLQPVQPVSHLSLASAMDIPLKPSVNIVQGGWATREEDEHDDDVKLITITERPFLSCQVPLSVMESLKFIVRKRSSVQSSIHPSIHPSVRPPTKTSSLTTDRGLNSSWLSS